MDEQLLAFIEGHCSIYLPHTNEGKGGKNIISPGEKAKGIISLWETIPATADISLLHRNDSTSYDPTRLKGMGGFYFRERDGWG